MAAVRAYMEKFISIILFSWQIAGQAADLSILGDDEVMCALTVTVCRSLWISGQFEISGVVLLF